MRDTFCERSNGAPLKRRAQAPIQVYRRASDVSAPVGREESDEIRIFLSLSHPSQGDALCHVGIEIIDRPVASPAIPLGAFDQANADRVHPDLVGGEFRRQRFRQIQPCRAHDRCWQCLRRGRLAAADCSIDDGAAAPRL